MKSYKKLVAAILCCLFAASCAAKTVDTVPDNAPEKNTPAQQKILTAAVQNGLSDASMQGFKCFSDKVEEISNGSIKIETAKGDDILDMLDEGYDIAFASNAEFARANGDFLIYSSPFYFTDYNHLTMTLNSQQFYSAMKNTNLSLLNSMPLGAFYDGNNYIISSREEMYDTIDQYSGRLINIIGEQPLFEEVLNALDADVKEREIDYMLSNFGKNRNISAMECSIDLLGDITRREKVESFHICKSFHSARINWIMLSQPTREELSEYEMAVLTEAMAYAVAKNDSIVISEEQKSLEMAEDMGGTLTAPNYNEFFEAAAESIQNSDKYSGLWDWQLYNEVRKMAL